MKNQPESGSITKSADAFIFKL